MLFNALQVDRVLVIGCYSILCSGIDEIVLSYMVSILEELGTEDSLDDVFDVEAFTDMMEAYMPGFAQIDR